MYLIVQGNPVGGYVYVGMFAAISEANAWAADHLTSHFWVVRVMDKAGYKPL